MAVVKANGFGHGAVPVARTVLASGASWLGVTSVAEALELREAGITAPVLAWMHLPHDDLRPVIDHGIDLAVSSQEHLEAIGAAGRRHGFAVAIHLKVDTGLHRGGCRPDRLAEPGTAGPGPRGRGRRRGFAASGPTWRARTSPPAT